LDMVVASDGIRDTLNIDTPSSCSQPTTITI
jgi:hypothetical protein